MRGSWRRRIAPGLSTEPSVTAGSQHQTTMNYETAESVRRATQQAAVEHLAEWLCRAYGLDPWDTLDKDDREALLDTARKIITGRADEGIVIPDDKVEERVADMIAHPEDHDLWPGATG